MLIDSHAHLDDDRLKNEIDNIVSDMDSDFLEAIVNVGCDLPSSKRSVELAKKYEKIFATVGIHPHDAKDATQKDYDYFASVANEKKMLAIGEIGLDYHYDLSPRETQKKVFLEQMELAYSLQLPIVIHLREAYGDMYKLLKENKSKLYYGAILHCYSGSVEMMKEFVKMNFYFSFGGSITFKNASEKPLVIKETPMERILLETDSPYMTPVPYRGKNNYPRYVNLVAQTVAKYKSKTYFEIVEETNRNTKEFFRKMKNINK